MAASPPVATRRRPPVESFPSPFIVGATLLAIAFATLAVGDRPRNTLPFAANRQDAAQPVAQHPAAQAPAQPAGQPAAQPPAQQPGANVAQGGGGAGPAGGVGGDIGKTLPVPGAGQQPQQGNAGNPGNADNAGNASSAGNPGNPGNTGSTANAPTAPKAGAGGGSAAAGAAGEPPRTGDGDPEPGNFARLAIDALANHDGAQSMNKPPPPRAHGPDLPPPSGPEPPPPLSLPKAIPPILLSEKDTSTEQNSSSTDSRGVSSDKDDNDRGHDWEGPAFILFGFLPIAPWVVGLCFGITGYTFCGLGMNLIRLSHIVSGSAGSTIGAATTPLSTNHASTLRETPFNRPANPSRATILWLGGYFFNSIGGSLNIIGLRFAAQSLMAPLSSTALIANAFFATVLCGERLSLPRDAPSMILIAVGNTLTVLSASHKGFKDITVHEFSRLFFRPAFQAYLKVVLVLVVLLLVLKYRFLSLVKRHGGREYASQTLIARMGLCHAAAGCMFCVHSALFSKGSMLILAQGLDQAVQPAFAPIWVTWLCLVSIWVYTLNRLLKEYDALFIIPVIEVVWSLQSMISGGIFFVEYSSLSKAHLMLFGLGVAVNITGVVLLSQRGEKKKLAE